MTKVCFVEYGSFRTITRTHACEFGNRYQDGAMSAMHHDNTQPSLRSMWVILASGVILYTTKSSKVVFNGF
jgi:hypothetical protein